MEMTWARSVGFAFAYMKCVASLLWSCLEVSGPGVECVGLHFWVAHE